MKSAFRSVLLLRCIFLAITAAFAALSSALIYADDQMMAMPLVAPYYIENEAYNSTLTMVNYVAVSVDVDIEIHDPDGAVISNVTRTLPSHSHTSIPLSSLINSSRPSTGSIFVTPKGIGGMPVAAQLSITSHRSTIPSYLEEELQTVGEQKTSTMRGVAAAVGGIPVIALTNLATLPRTVTVTCMLEESEGEQHSVRLEPKQSILARACGVDPFANVDLGNLTVLDNDMRQRAIGIVIKSDGEANDVIGYGFLVSRHGFQQYYTTIDLLDPATMRSPSTVFVGIPVGRTSSLSDDKYTPEISVANLSNTPARVTISFSTTIGDNTNTITVADFTLGTKRTEHIKLHDLEGSDDLQNSLIISSDAAPGDVLAKVISQGESRWSVVDLPGRDQGHSSNGGAHPWFADVSSRLLIYNQSNAPQRFTMTIWWATDYWGAAYILKSHETKAININSIIDHHTKDGRGHVIPKDARDGEVHWVVLDSNAGVGRLMQVDPDERLARNYSCPFTTVPCAGTLSPQSNVRVGANGSGTLQYAGLLECSGLNVFCGNYPFDGSTLVGPDPYDLTNVVWGSPSPSGIASASGSCTARTSCTFNGVSSGTASVWGQVFSTYCSFPFNGTLTVTPVLTGISPAQGLVGTAVSATISGAGFSQGATIQAGSGITISITNVTATQIQASFSIASNAPGGNHAVTVTANGQTSSPTNFNVQVPKYFFSPSAVQTSTPAACTQANGIGFFLDVSYFVADANSNRVSQLGMDPGENINGVWHDDFATPATTRSDGSFDDVPRGACYQDISGHFCAPGNPQAFRLTNNGTMFAISTNVTSTECTDGIKLVIQGNPVTQNKTYTFGNIQ